MRTLCCILLLVPAAVASAASIDMGTPQIRATEVRIPIRLSGDVGDGVAALNFDVSFDPEVLEPVSALTGPAAAAADKRIQAHESGRGQYRVVMFDVNMNAVQGGEVATVVFKRASEPASGTTGVRILRTTLASAEGTEISSRGGSRLLEFSRGEDNGGEDEEDEDDGGNGDSEPSGDEPDAAAPDANDSAETEGAGASSPLRRFIDSAASEDGASPAQPPPAPAGDGAGGGSAGPDGSQRQGADLSELADAIARAEGARSELPAVPEGGSAETQPGVTATGGTAAASASGALARPAGQDAPPLAAQSGGEGAPAANAAGGRDEAEADPQPDAASARGGKIPTPAIVIAAVIIVLGLLAVRRLLFG